MKMNKVHTILVVAGMSVLAIANSETLIDEIMTKKRIAYVDIIGEISAKKAANFMDVSQSLKDAFEDKKAVAVVMRINSPGGSPAQSDMIYREAVYLKREHKKPLYAVIEDVCASGGYYIAVAADEIYAQPSSLVGSIGVISSSFGFVDVMKKIGIERRQYSVGKGKGMLDPFRPVDKEGVAHFKSVMSVVHKQFISTVREGRGSKPKESVYGSAYVYSGEQAQELGLVDGIKSINELARAKVDGGALKSYSKKRGIIDKITGAIRGQVEDVMFETVNKTYWN